MEENIFNADQANVTPAADTTQAAPQPTFTIPTEVAGLVGDGKKYKTVDDALKSVPHAQTHISTLEEENRRLKEELIRRKTAEDVLNEMKQISQPAQQNTTGGVEADPNVLSQIVEQVLEKKQIQSNLDTNAKVVTSKFIEVYGDKAESVYNELVKKHGMTLTSMNQLAMTSPAAVLALAGLNGGASNTSGGKMEGSVMTPPSGTNQAPSARVPRYHTTKDVLSAFAASRQKVMNNLNNKG